MQQAERLDVEGSRRERVVDTVEERARAVHAAGMRIEPRIARLVRVRVGVRVGVRVRVRVMASWSRSRVRVGVRVSGQGQGQG